MQTDKKTKRKRRKRECLELNTNSKTPAGLAKSKRLIKTERDLEIQFEQLCKRIKLDDFKSDRSDKQNTDRKAKRKPNFG